MIFINLLPDIKLEYQRMVRVRRILVSLSIIIFALCVALCVIVYTLAQQSQVNLEDAEEDNDKYVTDNIIQDEVAKILNLRYRVDIIRVLHEYKTEPERLFLRTNYIDKLIPPSKASYSQVSFSFEDNTFSIEGSIADNETASTVAKIIDYIGFDDCKPGNLQTRRYAFFC